MMIERVREYYKAKDLLNEFEVLKSMYITNLFSPILKLNKEVVNFRLYKLDFFSDDNIGMIETYYEDNKKNIVIKFKETSLIKFIRESYINELLKCCEDTPPTGNKNKGEDNEINELNKHYKHHRIEPLDIIDEYELDFYLGNSIKYILRSPYKGSEIDDLLKAKNYIELKLDRHFQGSKNDNN